MTSLIFRLYRVAQYSKLTRSPSLLRVLSQFPKLDVSVLETNQDGTKVFLRGTDVETTAKGQQFLLQGLDCVKRLTQEAGACFRSAPDGVLLEVCGVKLLLQHWEELFIAEEVFAGGVYNLRMEHPFVLIDVGMNVGTTSLFFASQERCQVVHAFELFPPTVEKAQKNFALNPAIATKIKMTPKGLAAKASAAEMDYVEEYKGSIGLGGVPDYVKSQQLPIKKVRVEFASCVELFGKIFREHSAQTIVCKLDCEGAEYEILETLGEAGLLSQISCFMIEWHKKGAAIIESVLQRHGFRVLSFSPKAPNHSMIYAWRDSVRPA